MTIQKITAKEMTFSLDNLVVDFNGDMPNEFSAGDEYFSFDYFVARCERDGVDFHTITEGVYMIETDSSVYEIERGIVEKAILNGGWSIRVENGEDLISVWSHDISLHQAIEQAVEDHQHWVLDNEMDSREFEIVCTDRVNPYIKTVSFFDAMRFGYGFWDDPEKLLHEMEVGSFRLVGMNKIIKRTK